MPKQKKNKPGPFKTFGRLFSKLPKKRKPTDEKPLRAELYSIEQLEQHAVSIAGWNEVDIRHGRDKLLPRLAENEQKLIATYELLMAAMEKNRRIVPAGEWLIDNFYLVEEQIRTIRRHFPKGYSRELPRLLKGPLAGYPRVYEIAFEIISHGDARVDEKQLATFVSAYQSVVPLKLGELWAIPIMIRLALVENLRRVAARIASDRRDRDAATYWSERMIEIAEKDPNNLVIEMADMARMLHDFTPAFVSEFARRLQGQSAVLTLPLSWLEQRLSETGSSTEQCVQMESQQEASDQVSIGNTINSLRSLGAIDWREFVGTMSVTEKILSGDPHGSYADMDFATRDRYRHEIERIARRTGLPEEETARKAVQTAQKNSLLRGKLHRSAHVGYYLIDKGLREFEKTVKLRPSFLGALVRFVARAPLFFYGSAFFLFTAFAGLIAICAAYIEPVKHVPLWAVITIVLLCSSRFALALVNWLATLIVPPRGLPRMDFSEGIPSEYRTLVVVPSLINSKKNIDALIDNLEIRYLANRDENLFFGLLTDFYDAPHEKMPDDDDLISCAAEGIKKLNQKYATGDEDRIFLFHRPRVWNPSENIWMSYERKRGKLAELNALLRGKGFDGAGYVVVGDTSPLESVKYVITLDTDTHMPLGAGRELVAAMAHPLNRPVYDQKLGRVVEGYGILQPRVAVSMSSANRSLFVMLTSGDPGIDPYTLAVSDVYQDVFGEGSFVGKGIYDVDVFIKALDNTFPDNLILSHDLLEGCYARSGIVSDIQFFEDYPSCYTLDARRRHRWVRGDWQILAWLLPFVPSKSGRWVKNNISLLSKWKIFDNLRRSLTPISFGLLFIMGWALSVNPVFWTLYGLGLICIQPIANCLAGLFKKNREFTFSAHIRAEFSAFLKKSAQTGLMIMALLSDACSNADAIMRAIKRTLITRRKILEWVTSKDMKKFESRKLVDFLSTMWGATFIAAALLVYLALKKPQALAPAFPVLALWFFFPLMAWMLSRPLPKLKLKLTQAQNGFLRDTARRTWRYFEKFVNAENNWLPPDNYQESPVTVVTKRTSPTNIGMALLANLSANDFGYISSGRLIERTANTYRVMEKLERFKGNFFNWYNTETLTTLHPLYVSSVDSGNLSGALLVLGRGLLGIRSSRVLPQGAVTGIADTAAILASEIKDAGKIPAVVTDSIKRILSVVSRKVQTPAEARALFMAAAGAADEITNSTWHDNKGEVKWWAKSLSTQARDWAAEIDYLLPWINSAVQPDAENSDQDGKDSRIDQIIEEFYGPDCAFSLEGLASVDIGRLIKLTGADPENTKVRQKSGRSEWSADLIRNVKDASARANERLQKIDELASKSGDLADMDFDCLFNKSYNLLAIGYNVSERRLDAGCYDLLASESRLASFVGIALGRLPQDHWFALGRLLTSTRTGPVLLSWGGSMFEYLMPLLVMPTYPNTLLDTTYKASIDKQIEYASRRKVPWGLSESGYNMTDAHMNYQYRAFGVPDLGFKRGLADDLVIAPYASVMALMVSPSKACSNLMRMRDKGFMGKYGFYEAVDYTPSHLPHGQNAPAVVRSYMAHHQGMSFLSIAYLLLDRPMQKRFLSEPRFQSAELLLHERLPKTTLFHPHANKPLGFLRTQGERENSFRIFDTPNTRVPEVHLLSNGRYNVMVTNSGGGYSRWKNLSVSRWRSDATKDNHGMFIFMKDVARNMAWSAAYHPVMRMPEHYEAIFSMGKAEFRRRDEDIDTYTQIAVSPEDDMELRRVSITNNSGEEKRIELTSYFEAVMAPHAADALHPAFSKLFVQTEIVPSRQAILCSRRKRSREDEMPYMYHLVAVHAVAEGNVSYETDRRKFIGRGKTVPSADAMSAPKPLSNSQGTVLDPIAALRCRVIIAPEGSATIDFVTGMAETKEKAMEYIEKYRDRHLADRVFDLAWTHQQVVLQQLNASEAEAQLFGRLANSIIYPNYLRRVSAGVIMKNRRGQSGLWGYSISGDLPIVLVKISDQANIDLVRQMTKAHAYWRIKGLDVDLVIWNEDHSGYRQALQDKIMGMVSAGTEAHFLDRPGGIFVRRSEQISEEDKILFHTVARIIVSDTRGSLAEQIDRRGMAEPNIPKLSQIRTQSVQPSREIRVEPRKDLEFFNGIGGFTRDGREYVMTLGRGISTPQPWSNVIANPFFGTVVSEGGGAYTWRENASQFRITPWHNDPVSDTSGEAFYVRDDETGRFWSPSPLPAPGTTPYVVRHGCGYSVFEHTEEGIKTELWIYVAIDAPVKYSVMKIKNVSGRARRISLMSYIEPVMGELRERTQMHLVTETDPGTGALFVNNKYNTDFTNYTVFLNVAHVSRSVTGDRTEFLGRNGTAQKPVAMSKMRLSNKTGAGLDACAAVQARVEIADGENAEIVFVMGAGKDAGEARELVRCHQGSGAAEDNIKKVWDYWNHMLGAVYVQTPDQSVNVITNGWLLYQTMACRMWARAAYYQSGGAFGFRDQLQDSMALVYAAPYLLREQIVKASSRQFKEGDVQHWWHEPTGAGVRTRFSDDYLWLPFTAAVYVKATGDTGVLDENIDYLEDRPVKPEEDAYYDRPLRSKESGTIYDHCLRAIKRGLTEGPHGLPLMGTGDWNDGMNLVGFAGKGESVWLAFFMYYVLSEFRALAETRGDEPSAGLCELHMEKLAAKIHENAWDGKWYRRAYFDDGTPLGSADNDECRIDSLPQSWAVISGAADPDRARTAMEEAYKHLVNKDKGLVQLFDPPFDSSSLEPGYLKGYPPGIRENGGQYTHAAVWMVIAFVLMGDNDKAWELFRMINPVNHSSNAKDRDIYKVEPYVVAADISSSDSRAGNGGWTWYTGSAGWMYRLIVEHLLGIRMEHSALTFSPCVPDSWKNYVVHFRFIETVYHIYFDRVGPAQTVNSVKIDGNLMADMRVNLINDNVEHELRVEFGA